jgi:membrane protein implicated in regulation of membrane protease activity
VNEGQFFWGLSNGVIVCAIAGAFWLGLGIGTVATEVGWLVCALSTVLQVGVCAALLWAAVRLRRKSGFRASELRQRDGRSNHGLHSTGSGGIVSASG